MQGLSGNCTVIGATVNGDIMISDGATLIKDSGINIADIPIGGPFVPYTGATGPVDLNNQNLTDVKSLSINYVPPTFPQASTIYLNSATGNDATGARGNPALPFLTFPAAQAVQQNGDCLKFTGNFNIGNNVIDLSAVGTITVHLIGAGMNTSSITSTAILTAAGKGCIIKPGNDSVTGDFQIIAGGANSAFQGLWGMFSNVAGTIVQPPFLNAIAYNLKLTGFSDAFFVRDQTQNLSGAFCSFTAYNCTATSTFDTHNVFLAPGYFVNLFNCSLLPAGPSAAAGGSNNVVRAISTLAFGSVNAYNCILHASGSTQHNYGAVTQTNDAFINLFNCTLLTSASGGGDAYDINGNVNYSNCTGSGTGGALTIAPGSIGIALNYLANNFALGDFIVGGTLNAGTLNTSVVNAAAGNFQGDISANNGSFLGNVTATEFITTNGDIFGAGFIDLLAGSIYLNNGAGSGGVLLNLDGAAVDGGNGAGTGGGIWSLDGATLYGSAPSSGASGGTWYLGDGSGAHGGVINGDAGTIVDVTSVTTVGGVILGPSSGNTRLYMNEGDITYVNDLHFYAVGSKITWPSFGGFTYYLTPNTFSNAPQWFDGTTTHDLAYTGGSVSAAGSNGNLQINSAGILGAISNPGSSNQVAVFDNTGFNSWQNLPSASGTVTSVGISSSSLSLSGANPVTGSGTINIEMPSGGIPATITTAPLSSLGSTGSMTFNNYGQLISQTQAT